MGDVPEHKLLYEIQNSSVGPAFGCHRAAAAKSIKLLATAIIVKFNSYFRLLRKGWRHVLHVFLQAGMHRDSEPALTISGSSI